MPESNLPPGVTTRDIEESQAPNCIGYYGSKGEKCKTCDFRKPCEDSEEEIEESELDFDDEMDDMEF